MSNFSSRFFTPKEFRAVLLFIVCGLAVALWRGGRSLVDHFFPGSTHRNFLTTEQKNDSLFSALSLKELAKDSLQFWMPGDSNRTERYTNRVRGTSKKVLKLTTEEIALNSCSKDSLTMLPGIGEKMAERIISYRNERGKFRRLHELTNIEGIGEKRFKQIEPYIRLY